MADGQAVTVISPGSVAGTGETGSFPFEAFDARCLAQGDSWFSIGAFPPAFTTSVLVETKLTKNVVAVNCARPGKVLQHMTSTTSDPAFVRLITGPLAFTWGAILISGGGNDLIDAARLGPGEPPDLRLLARPDERGAGPLAGDDYISNTGWATFVNHMSFVFGQLVDLRDSGINKGVPLLLHTYAHVMPRPAPAGFGFGPWLQPAMLAFAIPPDDWMAVSAALMDRLAVLFQQLIAARRALEPDCALHLVDTRAAALVPGDPASAGSSGDFVNEIHPTRGGYAKVGAVWRQALDPLL
ncbi:MAG: hypothetical protein ABI699_11500 [Caldimonas sp.]